MSDDSSQQQSKVTSVPLSSKGRDRGADAAGQSTPSYDQEHEAETPKAAWAAVLLMIIGFAMVGVAVVLISISATPALVVGGVGVLIGLLGVAVAVRSNVMENYE